MPAGDQDHLRRFFERLQGSVEGLPVGVGGSRRGVGRQGAADESPAAGLGQFPDGLGDGRARVAHPNGHGPGTARLGKPALQGLGLP